MTEQELDELIKDEEVFICRHSNNKDAIETVISKNEGFIDREKANGCMHEYKIGLVIEVSEGEIVQCLDCGRLFHD